MKSNYRTTLVKDFTGASLNCGEHSSPRTRVVDDDDNNTMRRRLLLVAICVVCVVVSRSSVSILASGLPHALGRVKESDGPGDATVVKTLCSFPRPHCFVFIYLYPFRCFNLFHPLRWCFLVLSLLLSPHSSPDISSCLSSPVSYPIST